jgi:hypothetical protein
MEKNMNEHESNLHDLYAGFAMMALLNKAPMSTKPEEIAYVAHEQAAAMLEERAYRCKEKEGGIADIINKWQDES